MELVSRKEKRGEFVVSMNGLYTYILIVCVVIVGFLALF
jgi:hypothetical protein